MSDAPKGIRDKFTSAALQAAVRGDPSDLATKVEYQPGNLTAEERIWIAGVLRGELDLPRHSLNNVKEIVATMLVGLSESEGFPKKETAIDIIQHAFGISRTHAFRLLKTSKTNLTAQEAKKVMSKKPLTTEE